MTRAFQIASGLLLLGLLSAGGCHRQRASAPEPPAETTTSPSVTPGPSPLAPTAAAGEDLAPLFARRLAALAEQDKLGVLARGNVVTFDLDAIALDTRIEHDDEADGQRRIGVAVGATFNDGAAPFHFISGAIGVGRTRAEAIDQAIGGWLGLSGKALLEAVPRRTVSTKAIPLGPLAAFPGALAVRGTAEVRWTARRDRELVAALAPALGDLNPASSHGVALTIMILGGGAIDGECLVDNRASEELCKLAKKFDWTGSAEGYLARQVYLLRPALGASGRK